MSLEFLNLNEVNLYVSEHSKSDLLIDSIIRGIDAGDSFPIVRVGKKDCENFYLLRGINGGGHHRALGHYLASSPLRVWISEENSSKDLSNMILVRDMKVVDDSEKIFSKYSQKIMHLRYR